MELIKVIIDNPTLTNQQKLELIQKVNNQEPQQVYTKLQKDNWTYKLYPDGTKVLHSFNDQPAIIYSNGTKIWYKDGKIHRDTLPAYIYADGTKHWYKDDKVHRDDKDENNLTLPAYIQSNGYRSWWKDGKRHRDELGFDASNPESKVPLPAIIESDGSKKYYKEDKEYKLECTLVPK